MEPSQTLVKMHEGSNSKNEIKSTGSSLDEFIKGFDTVHRTASFAGIQFKNANLELNTRLVGTLLFVVIIYTLCFYTGWNLRGDWLRWLETLLILVLNVQGTSKIWAGVVQQPQYFYLFQTSEKIYAIFDSDERNRPILRDMVTKMVFILKATTVIYVTAGGAIIFSVVLYSAFTRQHFIAISVFIPYVDHTSSIGYMLTFVVHALMIVFCCNGYLASDTAFMATVVLIIGYANSLQNEIVNFNHLLTMPKRDEKLISEKMARIGHLHQMVVEFELDAVKHFQGGCLVQILTQAGAVLICIFLGYICGYVQAFSVLVGLCFQITQYCALGTIVTAKSLPFQRDSLCEVKRFAMEVKNSKSSKKNKKVATGSSLDEFTKAFDTLNNAAYYVGLNFQTLELDLNIRIFGSALFMIIIYVLCILTCWKLREDWQGLFETLVIIVLNIQGTNKIWIAVVHKPRYFRLFQTSQQIYESFDADERNRPILRDMVAKMIFFLKGMIVVYATAGGAIIVFVFLYVAFTRQKFMPISVHIPYVDHSSWIGYIITFVAHSLMIVYCCNGYLTSDTAFVATVVPIIGYANSFQNEISNFNQLLTMPKRDEKLIEEKLARIRKLHQMIVDFELDAIEHYAGGCLVQISTQAGSVLLCIFLGYICGYVQAISISMGLAFQITQYCALGTIVTAKNEQITADIYDIGWNKLQKPQQQMVAFMLHRAQIARDLTVGQVAPLNMVTYVKIMKTMYSFFAMLVTVMR